MTHPPSFSGASLGDFGGLAAFLFDDVSQTILTLSLSVRVSRFLLRSQFEFSMATLEKVVGRFRFVTVVIPSYKAISCSQIKVIIT